MRRGCGGVGDGRRRPASDSCCGKRRAEAKLRVWRGAAGADGRGGEGTLLARAEKFCHPQVSGLGSGGVRVRWPVIGRPDKKNLQTKNMAEKISSFLI